MQSTFRILKVRLLGDEDQTLENPLPASTPLEEKILPQQQFTEKLKSFASFGLIAAAEGFVWQLVDDNGHSLDYWARSAANATANLGATLVCNLAASYAGIIELKAIGWNMLSSGISSFLWQSFSDAGQFLNDGIEYLKGNGFQASDPNSNMSMTIKFFTILGGTVGILLAVNAMKQATKYKETKRNSPSILGASSASAFFSLIGPLNLWRSPPGHRLMWYAAPAEFVGEVIGEAANEGLNALIKKRNR